MMHKYITLYDLAKAIRKNGLPQAREAYFKDKDGDSIIDSHDLDLSPAVLEDIGSACALGQARINLGFFVAQEWKSFWTSLGYSIRDHIISSNDNKRMSLDDIATSLESWPDKVIWEQE